uniref:ATP synthase CF0 A subunit n=1 Tax=Aeginetia indica TaxID=290220 RepID=A0A8F2YVB6_9LAMI|nr:ATP synthase CF0 A subunit [Aeginetia indica]
MCLFLYDISGVEVGQHFYWKIGGFQIHAQVLITSWVVITILLGSAIFLKALLRNIQKKGLATILEIFGPEN